MEDGREDARFGRNAMTLLSVSTSVETSIPVEDLRMLTAIRQEISGEGSARKGRRR